MDDVFAQGSIRKWFVFSTLKNAFGGSSDRTLTRLCDLLIRQDAAKVYSADELYSSLGIEPSLNDDEINHILEYEYQGRYTNLVLSSLYPDNDWKDKILHADHIFPKSEFKFVC